MSDDYLIYLRKSRADMDAEARGEGETLARHENALLEFANKHKLNITAVYKEIVSGDTIAARPYMQRTLSEVGQGMWAGVLVMEIERLARGDTIDQGLVAQAFKYSNTKIITPLKTYDPSDEFDEEYFEFNLFMSRREYKTINRRIQRGRIMSAKEGKFLSSVAPYGYNKVKIVNDKGFTLEINPDQANVIKLIYDLYTEGELQSDGTYLKLGATLIARKLNDMGYKPMIRNNWVKHSIIDILKNPVYIGKIRWSYRKEKKYINNNVVKKSRTDSKDNDYILVDGLHEAIIDIDTFNKTQSIMINKAHLPVPGSDVLKNPLTGLLYCGKCHTLMTRLAKGKKTPYDSVKCMNVHCDNISSPLYLVEEVIIESFEKWLINFKAKWDVEKLNIPYAKVISDKQIEIKRANDKLNKLNDQKDRICDLLEQGVYSIDIFTERNKKITSESNDLQHAISELEKNLDLLYIQSNRNDIFIPRAEVIISNYYNMETAAERNEVLKELITKVEYVKTEYNKRGNRDNKSFSIELYPNVTKF